MSYTDEAWAQLGEPLENILPRDGDRDLEFLGWLLGSARAGWGPRKGLPPDQWTHGTTIDIYLTVGGRWVGQVERWGAGGRRRPGSEAQTTDTPEEIFQWLTKDGVGLATMRAWRSVREVLPSIPPTDRERVD